MFLLSLSVQAHSFCLNGLGPDWADVEADPSDPVPAVETLLQLWGETRPNEKVNWFRTKSGEVVYCRKSWDTTTSFLLEFREGRWIVVNSVRTIL